MNETAEMTLGQKLDLVLRKLDALDARLQTPKAPEKLCLSIDEAMELTGFAKTEREKWYAFCHRANPRVKPFRRGFYRIHEVLEAVARASFTKYRRKA